MAMSLPELTPELVFYGVLAFAWLEFAWSSYLDVRQRRVYRSCTRVPADLHGLMTEETFSKARVYALDKSSFGAVKALVSQLVSTAIIWGHGFKFVWEKAGDVNEYLGQTRSDEIYRSLWFTLMFNVFQTLIGLPFSVYSVFVVEERHGFNKQTAGFFVKDQIKSFIIGQAIMLPLIAVIIKIIQIGGQYFFLYLWLFVFLFTLIMMVVYPELIAPLFDKYTPLPEGELRKKIEELAASIQFPLYKLFVVEGSKRSTHSNAYFYGFFKFKRIVLFDTLLEESEREKLKTEEEKEKEKEEEKEEDEKKKKSLGCNTNEILAVLAHELGHWKLNHVLKNIVIAEAHIFLVFALFGYLYKQQVLYAAFGFSDGQQPVLIGLMIIMSFITAPYNALLDFLMTCLSRRFEFQADAFAVGLDKARDLETALVKLNNDNLSFPVFDWLYSAWHHSHPPLLERIAALRQDGKKTD